MNRLSTGKRSQILDMMVEGMSIRSITRMIGANKNTVVKLLAEAGEACLVYQDRTPRDLKCMHIQVDEVRSFIYAKAKNVPGAKRAPEQAGDVWMDMDGD